MNIPCNVLLNTGHHWTKLHDDQFMNPILHLDTCTELGDAIEREFHMLLFHYGYNMPLSIEIPLSSDDDNGSGCMGII